MGNLEAEWTGEKRAQFDGLLITVNDKNPIDFNSA